MKHSITNFIDRHGFGIGVVLGAIAAFIYLFTR